ncbi:protein MpTPS5 [Marchantia polymorpha subsp. ruderalis]|uniref:Uncharacterized protein n=2 Tax=Marchantia polymorpha TaxID=3197 RepID=A0AAF6BUK7_MARPO|nr:hypothetical protein MARPO_0046s0122 [Marchantia polymorpha]PTQ39316.1 hypothetical protein MARPO_0046s0122 [Marchantia polymorpha]UPQ49785.1 terpentedienyl diphosphate synthase [Marchantia polymorpha]BBN15691.1 hypothetical protein Mp_7g00020 [Marchantia polymorpha subsp. ruderalis]BBN15692.1 hypothetical protein Mp_7g00020 [Marchantia polymorpha subsp. ruderalis]|eukprot:PTQ39315.1 hypothetical protein MARPO_0046s0122 [Marchantia polymorpha]
MAMATSSTLSLCVQMPPCLVDPTLAKSRSFRSSATPDSVTTKTGTNAGNAVRIFAILLPSVPGDNCRYGGGSQTTFTGSMMDLGQLTAGLFGKTNAATLLQSEHSVSAEPSLFEEDTAVLQPHQADTIKILVSNIKQSLACLTKTEGEVSVSAYDTAFCARIPAVDDPKKPQFPQSLAWIVANQHQDGSWGDDLKDWVYDRMNQTLACVVAMRSWNYCHDCVQRGVDYLQRNADKLAAEEMERMPIGFELAFTAMLAEARTLGLDLPYDTPFFDLLEKKRRKKLERVPLELLHSTPTTMLHSLEGIQSLDIDWKRLLKFQSDDGSICCSPSSTAVLYMHTRDEQCLSFLKKALAKFDHAVPTVYPLDIFHNLWVVDTLERLGISRYFSDEIENVLAAVYKHWSDEQGICWASVLKDVPDLDDSSMAFRLLRQHGYKVSADAFKVFHKDSAFACFAVGQMVQGVSDMFNLYRASQLSYPGETRLDEALAFSQQFLTDTLTSNKGNADKWSLKKDLAGEIQYSLKYPESKNLERLEVREYVDKYGPEDAWIGKTIYRLPLVNNPDYLALAKADFNLCLAIHQRELRHILRWISNSGLSDSRSVRERIVMFYVMFSAEAWEPELSAHRIAASKCLFIVLALHQLFNNQSTLTDLRLFLKVIQRWDASLVLDLPESFQACYNLLHNTLQDAMLDLGHEDLTQHFVDIWGGLVESFLIEAEWREIGTVPAMDEYWNVATTTIALKATVWSSMLISGEVDSEEITAWIKKDCKFLRRASEAIRLAQGFADYKETNDIGNHISMFKCYLNENEELTVEDAVEHFETMREQVQKELCMYRDEEKSLSQECRKVIMSFTKVANFYYDGEYVKECNHGLQRLMVSLVD